MEIGKIYSNVISDPVVLAEAIASPALLQSTSMSDNGIDAEKNEPTGRDASFIHPTVHSHGLMVKCEGLLALYSKLSVTMHRCSVKRSIELKHFISLISPIFVVKCNWTNRSKKRFCHESCPRVQLFKLSDCLRSEDGEVSDLW